MIKPDARRSGLLWVALGAAMWGTDALFRSGLVERLTSLQIVWLEHALISLMMLPWIIRAFRKLSGLSAGGWLLLLAVSWGSSALATWAFTEAFRYGHPSAVVLLQKLQPLFAVLAAKWLLRERWSSTYYVVLPGALLGAYVLSFGFSAPFTAAHGGQWAGSLLAIAAALLWGCGTTFGRSLLQRFSFAELTGLRVFCALPMLTLLQTLQGGLTPALGELTFPLGLDLFLLSLVPGLAGLLLYYYGLQRTQAAYAAIAELSFPAAALLINRYFLGQSVSMAQIAGVLLIWLMVAYLSRQKENPLPALAARNHRAQML
ncbi:DMT family transporter [Paenibacillus gansuensis]|uniref:DMT family transporter n=1 Tax=Paenibacillus gansuensis TaxID=306542 RepID=A0ABW5PHW8_9BACL